MLKTVCPLLRFTARDLLWLMVVVALSLGWWLSYRHWTETNQLIVADRSEWLRRAIYLKAMFKQIDKSDVYTVDFLDGGKFLMRQELDLDAPLLTDDDRQLILSDAPLP
jgi:hypothetical protein